VFAIVGAKVINTHDLIQRYKL